MAQATGGFRNIIIPNIAPMNELEQGSARPIPEQGKFVTMEVGQGNRTMKTDERGSWWGSDSPETAPIFIDMDGNITMRSNALGSSATLRWYDDNGELMILIGGGEDE